MGATRRRSRPPTRRTPEDEDAASLAHAVLAEEAQRQAEQLAQAKEVVLPDDLLPGVGGPDAGLRDVVRSGGALTIGILFLLNLVDEFDRVALFVLGPDIQKSLNMSDATLAAVNGIGGLLVIVAAIPLGYLADRTRRTVLVGVTSIIWSAVALAVGFVHSVWQLAVTRVFSGIGKANGPVNNSILADAYPIGGRARIFALYGMANPIGVAIGPLLAGGVAALAGGESGWRWAFVVMAAPCLVFALAAFRMPEPRRGHYEKLAILGDQDEAGAEDIPPTLSAAFQRLKKIRTFYFVLIGIGAAGFALFGVPTIFNLFLEEHYGLDAFDRGLVGTVVAIGAGIGYPVGGSLGDKLFRRSPPLSVLLIGAALASYGVIYPLALYMPNLVLMVVVLMVAGGVVTTAFVPAQALIASVVPFRLRATGYAMLGIYIFLFGGFFGGIITGALSDAFNERVALTIVIPPSFVIGGLLIAYGARHVRRDISLVVEEMQEEQQERKRVSRSGAQVPVLQVRNLDFSYGKVQVLFDVSIDVWKGEVLALLGTNGAGKSTLLRAVSGLSMPDRGVVRFNGRTLTYSEAEARVKLGIVQVPGGKAIFPSMTVMDNLLAGSHQFIWDHNRLQDRIGKVVEVFPRLHERLDQPAGSLSGGEQQMLAIGKALLLEPELLLIDELSLGLAPVLVQELFGVVGQLKDDGITMVIVEQSVNVALSLADRAVFMEKGQVRFEGPAQELLDRDDLVRAVFLGAGGSKA